MTRLITLALSLIITTYASAEMKRWQMPLGGNAYLSAGTAYGTDRVSPQGITWQDPASKFSAYIHTDREAVLDLALRLRVPQGKSTIKVDVAGKTFTINAEGADFKEIPLGRIQCKPGYQHLTIQGVSKTGSVFAEISDLVVTSETPALVASFIRNSDAQHYYWGRRGPSIHLNYPTPPGKDIAYAYTEITVPEGQDPPGSYYMATGFGQGYCGMQVKSPTERWVIFSVWSPHHTNNPAEIPEDKRIILLRKGEGVNGGEFGGEGSGGKSYLVHPWKSGATYKFLLGVKPDGKGNTIYTAWFGEAGKPEWRLMASFKRPQTNTWLTGYHSFLENFHDMAGNRQRSAIYGNQWVCDTAGEWHEVTTAHFTGDAIANSGERLDYAGGVFKNSFFMRNGGYFNNRVPLGQNFTRPSTPNAKPTISFEKLEAN